eukprot:scaffold53993_cov57-Phaeocystis_antarctica.AAC.4
MSAEVSFKKRKPITKVHHYPPPSQAVFSLCPPSGLPLLPRFPATHLLIADGVAGVPLGQPDGAQGLLRAAQLVHLRHSLLGEEHLLCGHVGRGHLLHHAMRSKRHQRTRDQRLTLRLVSVRRVEGVELEEAILVAIDDPLELGHLRDAVLRLLDAGLPVLPLDGEVEGAVAHLLPEVALLERPDDADVDRHIRRVQGPLVPGAVLPRPHALGLPELQSIGVLLGEHLGPGQAVEDVAGRESVVVDARRVEDAPVAIRVRGATAATRGLEDRAAAEGDVCLVGTVVAVHAYRVVTHLRGALREGAHVDLRLDHAGDGRVVEDTDAVHEVLVARQGPYMRIVKGLSPFGSGRGSGRGRGGSR